MLYHIVISPEAQKEFRSLTGYVRAQAEALIDGLASNPRPVRARELRDRSSIYRIWLASKWRVVYEVNDEQSTILVLRIRRKEYVDYEGVANR